MATTNLDYTDLSTAAEGGVVREDILDEIYSIDPVDRPFLEAIDEVDASNVKKEFVQRDLRPVNLANAAVDGQDATKVKANPGVRLNSYCQILWGVTSVSETADNVDNVGRTSELLFQIAQTQKEIRRDEEGISLTHQSPQPGDGDEANAATTGPPLMAGAGAWLVTNRAQAADATAPAYSTPAADPNGNAGTPGDTAFVAGTKRALADSYVKDLVEDIYSAGGDPTMIVSTPKVIRKYSSFHFGSAAQIATLQSDKAQPGDGNALTAYGSVNVLATDFGITLELVPDRQQQNYDSLDGGADSADAADLIIMDPEYWAMAVLYGYMTEPLAKTGLADNRMTHTQRGLLCLNEKASGIVSDIDPTLAAIDAP